MKKILLVALSSVAVLSGCNSVEGTLTVVKAFNAADAGKELCLNDPNDLYCRWFNKNKGKAMPFEIGSAPATLEFTNENRVTLKTDGKKIVVLLPEGTALPRESGEVRLSSQQIGQPVDVVAGVRTDITDSDRITGTESCSELIPETVCRPEVEEINGRRVVRQNCKTEYTTVYGTQQVEYFMRYTDRHFAVDLQTPGTTETVAHFQGATHDSDKIYTYQGHCDIGYRHGGGVRPPRY